MGEESIKGANMGVILIIFSAILGLGLIVFMLGRTMANEGLNSITDKIETLSYSEFSDYDGKTVIGQIVLSSVDYFKGRQVAVLVATQGVIDKTAISYSNGSALGASVGATNSIMDSDSSDVLNGAVIHGHESMTFAYAAAAEWVSGYEASPDADLRKGLPASSSGGKNDKQLVFIQYNALLEPTDGRGVVNGDALNSVIWWNGSHYVFDGSFRTSDGRVMRDFIFTNMRTQGRTEMIPSTGRFSASLLKDQNGVILGVVFQQVTQ